MAFKMNMVKLPRSKKDEQEFGPGKKEYVVCPECDSAYFDKSWHHLLHEEKPSHLQKDKKVSYKLCPACDMKKKKEYEGEVTVIIRDMKAKQDVLNSIKNSDELARQRDTLDRVLWLEDKGSTIKVFTSENQLAVKIGKKLSSAHPGGKLEIKHSKDEDVSRVLVEI